MIHQDRNSLADLVLMFEAYQDVVIPASDGFSTACRVHDLPEIAALAATLRLHGLNRSNRADLYYPKQPRRLRQLDQLKAEQTTNNLISL